MLVLLSPAKSMNMERSLPSGIQESTLTKPVFLTEAAKLIGDLKEFDVAKISKSLRISESLAELNFERYQEWTKAKKVSQSARPAIALFDGDVYRGFNAAKATTTQLLEAQKRLRILSGLYGLIRPFDVINPYRLEMGSDVKLAGSSNLYNFWGSKIAEELNSEMTDSPGDKVLVNLASNEYFKAVDTKSLSAPIIAPKFLDHKPGKDPKIISFYAKVARGAMARWISDNKASTTVDLKDFDWNGYKYSRSESSDTTPTFIKKHKE